MIQWQLSFHESVPEALVVRRAYDNLLPLCPFLIQLVHLTAYLWNPLYDTEEDWQRQHELPHEFLLAVLRISSARLVLGPQGQRGYLPFPLQWFPCWDRRHHPTKGAKEACLKQLIAECVMDPRCQKLEVKEIASKEEEACKVSEREPAFG